MQIASDASIKMDGFRSRCDSDHERMRVGFIILVLRHCFKLVLVSVADLELKFSAYICEIPQLGACMFFF